MTPATAISTLRSKRPLVHCITNYVAMNIAANTLLAAGASPAMVHAEEEAAAFTAMCGGLTINIGTLSTPWARGMRAAAESANANSIPWVLDPVAHFISPYRGEVAQTLLALKPSIVRGNASEIIALSGQSSSGQGVDSGDSVMAAQQAALELARQVGAVIAITGEVDFVTDGTRSMRVTGGSGLMPQVTAMGCSLTALMGAYVAVSDPLDAAVASLAHFGAAGRVAHSHAAGPGSFQGAFLDALANVDCEELNTLVLS